MSGRNHHFLGITSTFQGVKCLAQGHNTAEVGIEPLTSRSGVRCPTTEPPRYPVTIIRVSSCEPYNLLNALNMQKLRFMLGKGSTGSTSPSMPAHTHTSSNIFDSAKGGGGQFCCGCLLVIIVVD